MAACDDDGQPLSPDVAAKLFSLRGEIRRHLSDAPPPVLAAIRDELKGSRLADLDTRNQTFFEEEVEKLERWAEDVKFALEKELKELDAEIRAARKSSKAGVTLAEKLESQRAIKALEQKRHTEAPSALRRPGRRRPEARRADRGNRAPAQEHGTVRARHDPPVGARGYDQELGEAMAERKKRLELTWIGKEERPRLEPRILLEDAELSYHATKRVTDHDIFDNRLIHGDNLLALKALEQEFTGKIKCIFIDPPYNTGSAFEHYDDGIEHSLWLSLMRERLEVLWSACSARMARSGSRSTTMRCHYLTVLWMSSFGATNFIAQYVWQKAIAKE